MTSPASPHFVVTSYMPGAPRWDPLWPTSGPTDRKATLDLLPDPSLITIQDLPATHPGRLHFQKGAYWVVLAIDLADYDGDGGIVHFQRGVVLFNGPAPQACEYIRSLGFPAPSSYGEVADVRDWGSRKVGDNAIVLGGFEAIATSGNDSLAFVQSGKVCSGNRSFAVSVFGEVGAGNRGVAITRYGTVASAGDFGLARVDEFGQAVAGRGGIAIAETGGCARCGERGVAIGLHGGDATAGEEAVAIAYDPDGNGGRATAARAGLAIAGGDRSSAQAGEGGILILTWYDGTRMRASVAHVGEGHIAADTPYKVDERGRFVEVITLAG